MPSNPFADNVDTLMTIPGISDTAARVMVSERGFDRTRFLPPGTSSAGRACARAATRAPASVDRRASAKGLRG